MFGLPGSPVAIQGELAQAGGQARQVFLLPPPGGLEAVPRPLQFGGRRPFIGEGLGGSR